MIENVVEFAQMQLGIDRNRGEPRVPAGEQRLDVLRRVAHHQGDAIAPREAEPARQTAGKRRDATQQRRMGDVDVWANTDGGALRHTPCGSDEKAG